MGINKDQVEGRAKEVAGKVQEVAGKAVGSLSEQAKGMANQVAGKAQAKFGDAKEPGKMRSARTLIDARRRIRTLSRCCQETRSVDVLHEWTTFLNRSRSQPGCRGAGVCRRFKSSRFYAAANGSLHDEARPRKQRRAIPRRVQGVQKSV